MATSRRDCSLEPAACGQLQKAVPREPRAAWTVSRAPDQNGEQTWIRLPRPSDTGVLGGPQEHHIHREVLLSEGKSPC